MKHTSLPTIGLDIGSNTISCTKLIQHPDGIEVLKDKSYPVRLSEGLEEQGELRPAAIERGLEALRKIVSKFDYPACRSRAVATAVLRMTCMPEAFIRPAEGILGTPIEIIDGIEEARLTAIGAVFGLPHKPDWVILDIGGQSTELSVARADGTWQSASMPLGVVKVTEQFFADTFPSAQDEAQAREYVRSRLHKYISFPVTGNLVCVGGTPTTLSMLVHRLKDWKREKVHGDVICLADTQSWFQKIVTIDTETRISQYGMKPMRADVFPAGILILDEMMKFFHMDEFTVSANGLRVGLALDSLPIMSSQGTD